MYSQSQRTRGENEMLTEDDWRNLTIELMRLPSKRTRQTRIGASDLADNCDRCLAMKMRGHNRPSPQADRPWMGAEWGTAGHLLMQERIDSLVNDSDDLTPTERQILRQTIGLPEDTRTERHIKVADLRGYGPVFGHIDVDMPDEIGDWKGSTRVKSAFLHDYLVSFRGGEPRWVKQNDTKAYEGGYKLKLDSTTTAQVSKRAYDEKMAGMVAKMDGYFGQQTMYQHGRELEGRPVKRGSIIWLNRDDNGYFDDPASNRYNDPNAHHDVWVM